MVQDDNAFLAHLHCVFLDLAIKAYIYYHACCVGCPPSMEVNEKRQTLFGETEV